MPAMRVLAFIISLEFLPCSVATISKRLNPSSSFQVAIDGIDQFVYMGTADGIGSGIFYGINASFVHVALNHQSPRRLQVTSKTPFRTAELRPRVPVMMQTSNYTVTFELRSPGNFILEFDGNEGFGTLSRGLMIFADFVHAPVAATMYFGPGLHMLPYDHEFGGHVLRLVNDSVVHVDIDAVLLGYIRGDGVRNVTIRGQGILAVSFWPGDPVPDAQKNACCCSYYGKRAIVISNSTDIVLDGITVVHATSWDVVLESTIGVHIRGLKIIAWQCMNDGIDIVSSQNVLVEHSFIRSNDDAIALKGTDTAMDTKNVVVRDNLLWGQTFGNCMEIGFELWNTAVKNVTFQRNICFHANRAVMSIHNAGHATVQDIFYDDIMAEGILPMHISHDPDQGLQLIDMTITFGQYSGPDTLRRGSIKRVFFSNISYRPNKINYLYSRLLGNSTRHMISDISFKDFRVDGQYVSSLSDLNASTNFVGPVHFQSPLPQDHILHV